MSDGDRGLEDVRADLADKQMTGASGDSEEPAQDEAIDGDEEGTEPVATSANGVGSRNKKKKPRLHWDEQNLLSNALEKERNAYPKIDEPKTPYHTLSGSEGGSSSGSAPQSPGSPAFIARDHLVGFDNLVQVVSSGSSADGQPRSVHIIEDPGASSGGDSSPRSREEFEAKRKQHYRAEYPKSLGIDFDEEDDEDDSSDVAAPATSANGPAAARENGGPGLPERANHASGASTSDTSRATDLRDEAGAEPSAD
jgi:hypothetical protein